MSTSRQASPRTIRPLLAARLVLPVAASALRRNVLGPFLQLHRVIGAGKFSYASHAKQQHGIAMASHLKTDCPYGFQIFSFDLLIVGMVDETLPHSLRSTFTLLCQRLYIDRFPHSELQVPRLVRVWSEVDRSVDLNKASTLPQVAACALTPPVVLCPTLQMMRPACTFISLCLCIADST